MLPDRDQASVALNEAAVAGRIGSLESQRHDSHARSEFRTHRRQRRGLDQRSVGIEDENVVITALDLIARRQDGVGGAPALVLDSDLRLRRGSQSFRCDPVAVRSDDDGDVARRPLTDGREDVRKHRAARKLVQDFGPGRAHAHALAGGKHDGQRAAGDGPHGDVCSPSTGISEGGSAAPNPLELARGATIAAGEPGFQPNAARIDAILPPRQKASRCAAKNDIQPEGLERNVLGCDALVSSRADFSFWLGATSYRVVLARLSFGERMTNTMADRQRREFLQLAVGGALAASVPPANSTPAAAEPLGQPVPFAGDTVLRMATELASKPFKAPETPPLPSVFSGLTFEQYAAIRRVPGTAIWSDQKLGFSLEPLHRGFVYTTPIGINIVENGMAEKVIYDAANFDFGPLKPPAPLGDLGFSGLRILKSADQGFEDVAIFQGATFYRARAPAQPFGLTARGLAIRPGEDPGEEFPLFREFWIEKPNPAANTLTVHALLDSQSVTGAFRFTLPHGTTHIIDTEMTLIARSAVDRLGLGAMAAAYLFSPLDHRRPDDVRAAAYESTGLQILTGKGEWLWRPVSNRETLQISAFTDVNPRGFGLS